MIEYEQPEPVPGIEVLKDTRIVCHKKPFNIKKGEIGRLFNGTYIFKAREGYVPYVSIKIGMYSSLNFKRLFEVEGKVTTYLHEEKANE